MQRLCCVLAFLSSAHCRHCWRVCSHPLLPQQNLNGVMVAVAELLSMKIPNSYEVLFPHGPARTGLEPKKGEAEASGE